MNELRRACPVRASNGTEIIGTLDLRDTVKFFVEQGRYIKHNTHTYTHKKKTIVLIALGF